MARDVSVPLIYYNRWSYQECAVYAANRSPAFDDIITVVGMLPTLTADDRELADK